MKGDACRVTGKRLRNHPGKDWDGFLAPLHFYLTIEEALLFEKLTDMLPECEGGKGMDLD